MDPAIYEVRTTTDLEILSGRPARDCWPSAGGTNQQISSAANATCDVARLLSDTASAPLGGLPPAARWNEALPDGSFLHPIGVLLSSETCDLLSKKMLPALPSHPKPPRAPKHSSRSSSKVGRQVKQKSMLQEPQQRPIHKDSLSQREIHIYSERQRRKFMSNLFVALQALLPEAKKRKDRSTILAEVIEYIESLQQKLRDLTRKRAEIATFSGGGGEILHKHGIAKLNQRSCRNYTAKESNGRQSLFDISLSLRDQDIFITFSSPWKNGLWSGILSSLQEHNVEVVTVTISEGANTYFHCIHAKVPNDLTLGSDEVQTLLQDLILFEVEIASCYNL